VNQTNALDYLSGPQRGNHCDRVFGATAWQQIAHGQASVFETRSPQIVVLRGLKRIRSPTCSVPTQWPV